MTNPEPSEDTRRAPPSPPSSLRCLKNSSKKSSNGEPGGSCGVGTLRAAATVWEVEMFTTASMTRSAASATVSGPLPGAAASGVLDSIGTTKERARAAARIGRRRGEAAGQGHRSPRSCCEVPRLRRADAGRKGKFGATVHIARTDRSGRLTSGRRRIPDRPSLPSPGVRPVASCRTGGQRSWRTARGPVRPRRWSYRPALRTRNTSSTPSAPTTRPAIRMGISGA